MRLDENLKALILKQNVLKNITVMITTTVILLWSFPYIKKITEFDNIGVSIYIILGTFSLGALSGYFSLSYANTDLTSTKQRTLMDMATFTFLTIVALCLSILSVTGIKTGVTAKF